MKISVSALVTSLVLGTMTVACELRPLESPADGVDLGAPLTRPMSARSAVTVPRPRTSLEGDEAAKANQILDDFLARSDKAFEQAETEKHLPTIERFFFQTGRFLEMVDLYRDVYNNKGPEHYIGPRLAWAYTFISRTDLANKVLTETEKKRPEDPLVFLVRGSIIAGSGADNANTVAKVRDNWKQVLELDPDFEGPMGFDASIVRARLSEIDQTLARSATKK